MFFSISLTVIFEGEFHSLVREELFFFRLYYCCPRRRSSSSLLLLLLMLAAAAAVVVCCIPFRRDTTALLVYVMVGSSVDALERENEDVLLPTTATGTLSYRCCFLHCILWSWSVHDGGVDDVWVDRVFTHILCGQNNQLCIRNNVLNILYRKSPSDGEGLNLLTKASKKPAAITLAIRQILYRRKGKKC